jgi:hypothetical protein
MIETTYEPINFTYYDPSNSFFKSTGKDHAKYTVYLCSNKDNCQAYAKGKCAMLCGLWGENCPYGKRHSVQGPTKRAKGLYDFIYSAKTKYSDVSHKLGCLKFTARVGDKVYIALPYLKNYVNPIDEVEGEHFIDYDKFDTAFIARLIDFRPRALMGGVITDYQTKYVPQFISHIKKYFPEQYAELAKIRPDITERIQNVNYIDKVAKLKTLKPGKVKLSTNYLQWDGTVLTAKGKDISWWGLGDEVVIITPNENTYVTIADNDTVTDDTVFKDE